jgi:hypothetical protein
MGSDDAFPIRQVLPIDLLGLVFPAVFVVPDFLWLKTCTWLITVYLHIIYCFIYVRGGRNGWMVSDDFG